jgi:hypothetical protein
MRRLWPILIVFLLACRALSPLAAPFQQPPDPVVYTPVVLPAAPAVVLPEEETDNSQGYSVRTHPDGELYVGDQVSFEVIAPPEGQAREVSARVRLGFQEIQDLGSAPFAPFGILGRLQATLTWVWDTRSLEPGNYTLFFALQPQGSTWTETVTLLPASRQDPLDARASWSNARSECCIVHYMTNTEAERDLPELLAEIDLQAEQASRRMGVQISEPITITLLPRLLGHGGFADQDIHVSYLDRNYTLGNVGMILHHEIAHVLDYRLGGDLRPSLLVEGLAVYLTGGHYQPELLLPRAAALLQGPAGTPDSGLGWYLPLGELADHFYTAQHEIGYLEGGALVAFMVQRWGWQGFSDFYRDIHPHPSGSQARAIEEALLKHFNLSLAELESAFQQELRRQEVPPGMVSDLRLTVELYDTARRYQELLDPSAYFLTPWLVDTREMRRLEITADYLRRPDEPVNLALETMLVQASRLLRLDRFPEVERLLKAANAALDGLEQGLPQPFVGDSLAADYFEIITFLQEGWFISRSISQNPLQPQAIWVEGDQATVQYHAGSPVLVETKLSRGRNGWRLTWPWEQGN